MRGTYEAFILVKVKDGSQYVCALNRRKKDKDHPERLSLRERKDYLDLLAIWN